MSVEGECGRLAIELARKLRKTNENKGSIICPKCNGSTTVEVGGIHKETVKFNCNCGIKIEGVVYW